MSSELYRKFDDVVEKSKLIQRLLKKHFEEIETNVDFD